MTCETLQPELVAYHFGAIDAGARAAVEAHLVACPGCLRGYLDLKRAVETGAGGPPPPDAMRERLRRAVGTRDRTPTPRPTTGGGAR